MGPSAASWAAGVSVSLMAFIKGSFKWNGRD